MGLYTPTGEKCRHSILIHRDAEKGSSRKTRFRFYWFFPQALRNLEHEVGPGRLPAAVAFILLTYGVCS